MKVGIRVKPGSSVEKIVKEGDEYIIRVREKAIEGKANDAVRKLLAREFNVKVGDVRIITKKGRKKIVEILKS